MTIFKTPTTTGLLLRPCPNNRYPASAHPGTQTNNRTLCALHTAGSGRGHSSRHDIPRRGSRGNQHTLLTLSTGIGERNPFHSFGSFYRSGCSSRDLNVILGMVKIVSSEGHFFEESKRDMPLMTRLVKPKSGFDLMLEFEKGHLDYIGAVEPQDVRRHAILAREVLILGADG
ncbi:hypothetical protein C8R42DRAFT_723597 [Lentinula raphanica]|nr:hypothetical protein C8R42DRAFT_723597 [Lentinula raphanica]